MDPEKLGVITSYISYVIIPWGISVIWSSLIFSYYRNTFMLFIDISQGKFETC